MCGKPGKGRHGTSHHAKPYIKYQIISSSRSRDICYESVNGRTDKRTDKRTDGRTDKVIAIQPPLYEWGYNILAKVSHVDQELLSLLEHLSPSPVYSRVRIARSLFVLLSFILLAIVLSVLLRFMASDYAFGIFKLFLNTHIRLWTKCIEIVY